MNEEIEKVAASAAKAKKTKTKKIKTAKPKATMGRPRVDEHVICTNFSLPLMWVGNLGELITRISTPFRQCSRSEIGRMAITWLCSQDVNTLSETLEAQILLLEKTPIQARSSTSLSYNIRASDFEKLNQLVEAVRATGINNPLKVNRSSLVALGIRALVTQAGNADLMRLLAGARA